MPTGHAAEPAGLLTGTDDATGLAGMPSPPRPVRREHYLSRVGSYATLMTVEWFPAADGSLKRRLSFASWPGF
jgi:hypothetical protein